MSRTRRIKEEERKTQGEIHRSNPIHADLVDSKKKSERSEAARAADSGGCEKIELDEQARGRREVALWSSGRPGNLVTSTSSKTVARGRNLQGKRMEVKVVEENESG
jgi:hypothetical protein